MVVRMGARPEGRDDVRHVPLARCTPAPLPSNCARRMPRDPLGNVLASQTHTLLGTEYTCAQQVGGSGTAGGGAGRSGGHARTPPGPLLQHAVRVRPGGRGCWALSRAAVGGGRSWLCACSVLHAGGVLLIRRLRRGGRHRHSARHARVQKCCFSLTAPLLRHAPAMTTASTGRPSPNLKVRCLLLHAPNRARPSRPQVADQGRRGGTHLGHAQAVGLPAAH